MSVSVTLSRYLGSQFVKNFLFMLFVLLAVIYLFDTVELLRRGAKKDVPIDIVLKMSLFKLPEVGQQILPFSMLFAAILTFWKLNQKHEIVIVRSAGFSPWQFLGPISLTALGLGILYLTVINPVSSLLLTKYEVLENRHLGQQKNLVALAQDGLWLRQTEPYGDIVFHGDKIDLENWEISGVMAVFFDKDDVFTKRIDAKAAQLRSGYWYLTDTIINNAGETTKQEKELVIKTELTSQDIVDSFSDPEILSFWEMQNYISLMESTGFEATKVRIHFHHLLSQPVMFAAMVLLAAALTLRPPRNKGTLILIIVAVIAGFGIFFLSNFLRALGASHQLPVALAAWSPAIITLLIGATIVVNTEDG